MTCSPLRLLLGFLSLALSAIIFWHPRPAEIPAGPHGTQRIQEMQVRLNNVSLGIMAYLQTHRPGNMESVKTEVQAAGLLLRRFKVEAAGTLPELSIPIETAHERQRQAVLTILNAESVREEMHATLEKNQAALLQILEGNFLVAMRGSAWKGSDRFRWLLTAIAEVKGLSPSLSKDSLTTKTKTFNNALLKYRHETSFRQTSALDEAQKEWDTCITAIDQIEDQQRVVSDGLTQFTQARADLDQALDNYRHANPPPLVNPLTHHVNPMELLHYALGFSGLIGALWLFWPGLRGRRVYNAALEDMIECVEAAVAGDLSRLPKKSSDDRLHRLANSLTRLSAVITRSENLVYHLAALVEASGDAIVSQNLDGKILSWNKGAQRLYGYSIEEVRGQSIGILSPGDQGSHLRFILESVKTGEKISPFETLHQAKSGRMVRALVKVAAIHDSHRQVIGVSFCAQELGAAAPVSPAFPLTDTFQRS